MGGLKVTTHELARKLLEGPDEPVYVVNEDAVLPEPVTTILSEKKGDWRHHHTNEPMLKDASRQDLPESYTLVM
jgi:hypothetical protein